MYVIVDGWMGRDADADVGAVPMVYLYLQCLCFIKRNSYLTA